mmetsp:Transcript_129980/g.404304  ORF Transcript_129980/g.404304 Transcript_129980/m.404304 type:complete len:459 (-) Transcript_129980:49-1425(-)
MHRIVARCGELLLGVRMSCLGEGRVSKALRRCPHRRGHLARRGEPRIGLGAAGHEPVEDLDDAVNLLDLLGEAVLLREARLRGVLLLRHRYLRSPELRNCRLPAGASPIASGFLLGDSCLSGLHRRLGCCHGLAQGQHQLRLGRESRLGLADVLGEGGRHGVGDDALEGGACLRAAPQGDGGRGSQGGWAAPPLQEADDLGDAGLPRVLPQGAVEELGEAAVAQGRRVPLRLFCPLNVFMSSPDCLLSLLELQGGKPDLLLGIAQQACCCLGGSERGRLPSGGGGPLRHHGAQLRLFGARPLRKVRHRLRGLALRTAEGVPGYRQELRLVRVQRLAGLRDRVGQALDEHLSGLPWIVIDLDDRLRDALAVSAALALLDHLMLDNAGDPPLQACSGGKRAVAEPKASLQLSAQLAESHCSEVRAYEQGLDLTSEPLFRDVAREVGLRHASICVLQRLHR